MLCMISDLLVMILEFDFIVFDESVHFVGLSNLHGLVSFVIICV